jgi:hypothetical protein
MARANIKAEVSADTTKFAAGMRRAQTVAQSTGKRIAASMGRTGAAMAGLAKRAAFAGAAIAGIAAAIGGAAMARGLKMAADLGGRLSDVAARTGIAAGNAALLERAFEDNGIAAAKLGPVINKMQLAISNAAEKGGAMEEAFAGIGLRSQELARLSPEAQFAAIQKAISGIDDPAKRAAAAMRIFGRSGGELNVLFSDKGALANAGKALGSQSEILNRRAATFDRISDILKGVGAKMQGFFVGMLDRIADPVLKLLERFETLDLAAIGQQAGDALKEAAHWALGMIDSAIEWGQTLMHWIKIAGAVLAGAFSPQLWESIGLSIKAAFLDAANVANGAFAGVVAGLRVGFQSAVEFLATVLQSFARPDFWQGLIKTFEYLALTMGQKLSGVIASVLEKIERIPGMKKILGSSAANMRDAESTMGSAAGNAKDAAAGAISPVMDAIAEAAKNSASKTASAITAAYEEGSSRFDTAGLKESAAELMGHVEDEIAEAMKDPDPMRKVSDIVREFFAKASEMAKKKDTSVVPVARTRGPLGSDNVFARDRARLGIASGLTTGGLGERRRVGKSNAEILGYQQKSLQEQSNDILADIQRDLRNAVTV